MSISKEVKASIIIVAGNWAEILASDKLGDDDSTSKYQAQLHKYFISNYTYLKKYFKNDSDPI